MYQRNNIWLGKRLKSVMQPYNKKLLIQSSGANLFKPLLFAGTHYIQHTGNAETCGVCPMSCGGWGWQCGSPPSMAAPHPSATTV